MNYNEIYKIVKMKFINHQDKFQHIERVVLMAESLAKHYNADLNKVKIAALLHDYSKYDTLKDHQKVISEADFKKYFEVQYVYHAISGSILAAKEFGIKDESVLKAIRYHIYGHTKMDLIMKIVLISDKIELGRKYPGVNRLRELAFLNLDLSISEFLESNIKFHEEKNHHVLAEQRLVLEHFKKEYYEETTSN